jgi:hypothetical protein
MRLRGRKYQEISKSRRNHDGKKNGVWASIAAGKIHPGSSSDYSFDRLGSSLRDELLCFPNASSMPLSLPLSLPLILY